MSYIIKPFSTTGIGSLPHINPEEACELILNTFDIPFWPQLPKFSFRESMLVQYSESMPFVRLNEKDNLIWIMRDGSDELERFYESYSDNTKIAISEDYAAGLHAFLKKIKGRRFDTVKGHVTGPITYTLGIKDNYGRYIYFDEELREISLMLLKAKVRWQIDLLKQHSDSVIIFIDEPIFSAIGSSSYLGVDSAEVLRLLKEMVSAIEDAGGIAGIHCCGRADWQMVIKSGVSILSFDAFDHFDTLAIYHEELSNFIQTGGYLAMGIVPTSDAISSVDDKYINELMGNHLKKLCEHMPAELVNSRTLITPSCGTGSRSIKETIKAFQLIMRLKEAMS